MMDCEILAKVEFGNKTFNIQPQNHGTFRRQPMPSMSVILTNYSNLPQIWIIFTPQRWEDVYDFHLHQKDVYNFSTQIGNHVDDLKKGETMWRIFTSWRLDYMDDFHLRRKWWYRWLSPSPDERMWMILVTKIWEDVDDFHIPKIWIIFTSHRWDYVVVFVPSPD